MIPKQKKYRVGKKCREKARTQKTADSGVSRLMKDHIPPTYSRHNENRV
jgi:hypothetical protein